MPGIAVGQLVFVFVAGQPAAHAVAVHQDQRVVGFGAAVAKQLAQFFVHGFVQRVVFRSVLLRLQQRGQTPERVLL